MARYLQAKCRRCRAENQKLFLKGERCLSFKCPIDKRENLIRKGPPGKSPGLRIKKSSGYGIQLKEKQKVKQMYGILERQFRRYFKIAIRQKGITGDNLIRLLETRLDNIVFRLHFATSRNMARQLVLHRHIEVNGRVVNVPSYQLKEGDVISVKEKDLSLSIIQQSLKLVSSQGVVPWLELDVEKGRGVLKQIPRRSDIIDLKDINEQLIVELYSK